MSRTLRITQLVFTLCVYITFTPLLVSAQQQDSVTPGVMKVRRPPVPSSYKVQLSYQYSPGRKLGFASHFFGKRKYNREAMQMAHEKQNLYPPQPVTLPKKGDDTLNSLQDSSFMILYKRKNDRPAEDYDWESWLNQYEHYFLWSDTAVIDSAVFIYEVNRNGHVEMRPSPVAVNDTSAQRLQRNLIPHMRRLWIWYPGVWIVREDGKQRQVNCTVTVTVYAIRDESEQRSPLKVVE
ncbi:MAG: hypothetical protein L6Q81_08720 [Bacteroidia bacterium]|nr:hypothetical protein [Bacteroidia bacterium]